MFKKMILLFALCTSIAHAEYRVVVPDPPGGGISTWTTMVVKQLNKFTDEPIVLEHIPGARNLPGANKFHNDLRFDNRYMLAGAGSHATNILVEKVDYDWSKYDAIGGQNLDIVVGRNPKMTDTTKLVTGNNGGIMDTTGYVLMLCGNLPSIDSYISCWKQKAVWVAGVNSSDQKMMILRGEFNVTRDPPGSWKKNYEFHPEVGTWNTPSVEIWYTNGLYDLKTNKTLANPNYPKEYFFEEAFKKKWGVMPTGEMYDIYKLLTTTNNVLQKTIWINKGNPNTPKLREALRKMTQDKQAMAEIAKESGGEYQWFIGDDMNRITKEIYGNVSEHNLRNIVKWYASLGTQSIFKPEMVTKK
jgi:hypothetical protein